MKVRKYKHLLSYYQIDLLIFKLTKSFIHFEIFFWWLSLWKNSTDTFQYSVHFDIRHAVYFHDIWFGIYDILNLAIKILLKNLIICCFIYRICNSCCETLFWVITFQRFKWLKQDKGIFGKLLALPFSTFRGLWRPKLRCPGHHVPQSGPDRPGPRMRLYRNSVWSYYYCEIILNFLLNWNFYCI